MKEDYPGWPYDSCGNNVPEIFERYLAMSLEKVPLPAKPTAKSVRRLLRVLLHTIEHFHAHHNLGRPEEEPLCCSDSNARNRSTLGRDKVLCRYVPLATLEKYLLFPGLKMSPPSDPGCRKAFYDKARIARINSKGVIHPVRLGGGAETVEGVHLLNSVFLTPYSEAPHRKGKEKTAVTAYHIASCMGLIHCLVGIPVHERPNRGLAVLRFQPDTRDRFFRPTILDAVTYPAFRPGPYDEGRGERFRYGWTRRVKPGELRTDEPLVTEERGCKEVIMKNRWHHFTSDQLTLDDVFFFEP